MEGLENVWKDEDWHVIIRNGLNNKYAIHAYTHGPVTGSGPSVKPLKYVTHLLVAS